ncbi:hypothetical protein ACJ41O_013137 [Fusarium nematophilum]
MPKYTEYQMEQAIDQAVATGNAKRAAIDWDVPRSTLQSRLKGREPKNKAYWHMQRLSPTQEKHLSDWILAQLALGLAPTHNQLREFAQRIVKLQGDTRPIGKNWVDSFLRRNPDVKTVRGKSIDFNRLNGASTEKIQECFARLALPIVKRIPPQYRYNIDETGIMEGKGDNGLVLRSSDDKFAPFTVPGGRGWSSILEAVNALGFALPPLVIFKGMTVQHQWFPEELEDFDTWSFTSSENGWTSDKIGLDWLKMIFIPLTKPAEPQTRLLIVDGHGSHESLDFMWECYINDIYILYLPPHCSHLLQPLDLTVFSVLKRAYRKEVQRLVGITDESALGKALFLKCYLKARKEAMKPETIRAGWKAAGMWPVVMSKPLNNPWFIERQRQRESRAFNTPSAKRRLPETIENAIMTPFRGLDVRTAIELVGNEEEIRSTARLLFRKVGKALDKHVAKIAEQEQEIQLLKAQVDHFRPKKRKKVKPSNNERFVNIKALRNTREQVRKLGRQITDDINTQKIRFEDLCDEFQLILEYESEIEVIS